MLTLVDGTFFPPGCWCYSMGPRQRTRGSSPRSLAGTWVFLQGFFTRSASIGDISASLGGATLTYLASSAFGAPQEV
jgi:hypothetical protein